MSTTEHTFRISNERIAHMHGVAEYCYRHASDDFYRLDPDEMYVLGLAHDIGYVGDKMRHFKSPKLFSSHEEFGAMLLRKLGYSDYREVAMHGDLLNDNYLLDRKLLLLIEADLKIGMSEEEIGYDARLEDIRRRHGKDSRAYSLCKSNVEFLKRLGR